MDKQDNKEAELVFDSDFIQLLLEGGVDSFGENSPAPISVEKIREGQKNFHKINSDTIEMLVTDLEG